MGELCASRIITMPLTILDKERIYEIKILTYTEIRIIIKLRKQVGFEALRQLGIRFQKNPGKSDFESDTGALKHRISEGKVSSLYKTPGNARINIKIMAMRLLARLTMTFMVLPEPFIY